MLANAIALIAVAAPFGLEAYKAGERVARIVLAIIAVAFVMLALLLEPISAAAPWAGEFISGIFASPVSWFVLFIALFFVVRPYWRTPPAGSDFAAIYDDRTLREEVSALAKTVGAVIDDYQRMSGLEARVGGEIDGLKLAVQSEIEARQMAQQVIERKVSESLVLADQVEAIRVDTAVANRDIDKLADIQKDHRERAQHSFHAIGARERLAKLEAAIERDASDLYDRLKAGETYDQPKWRQWENVHDHWERTLNEWLETATWYAMAVKQRILTVDDAKYSAGWTVSDGQFPDAEAVRVFKKFRIVHQQWESVLPEVRNGMEQVAFVGLSELEARHGRPAG